MKRFSKLKKQIENLFDPTIKMQFCCSAYPMRSKTGYAHNSIPRFCLKMDKDIIWDFPADFPIKEEQYGYWADHNGISALVREYIDTPISELLDKEFAIKNQVYDTIPAYTLTDLLIASDRRIGKEKLVEWVANCKNYMAYRVVAARLYGLEGLIPRPK